MGVAIKTLLSVGATQRCSGDTKEEMEPRCKAVDTAISRVSRKGVRLEHGMKEPKRLTQTGLSPPRFAFCPRAVASLISSKAAPAVIENPCV